MSANVENFIAKAQLAGAEVEQFCTIQDAADFLQTFFRENKIETGLISSGLKAAGPFAEAFPHFETRLAPESLWIEAGLVAADHGVAETGTLVHFDLGDDEKNVWTLPEICLCLLEKAKIVPDLEALAPRIAGHLSRTGLPSPQVSLVTGPSRTADIECQLTIGVHGPSRLIILLI
ncbi:MAG: lactate utilization protein [Candidatus Aminicenantes bacterium]|nr:lactate utilization protein [Candidatus Aminicenantes bacterium]